MTTKNNKNIQYGDVELPADEFEPRNVKVRVTTLIDEDVLLALKAIAKERGHKYQTLLNSMLRSQVSKEKPVSRPKIVKLIREIVQEELKKQA